MLRFNSWPPEVGEFHFTDSVQERINSLKDLDHRPDGQYYHYYLTFIGECVGSLLFANMKPRSQHAAKEAARTLTGDWSPQAAEVFMEGVSRAITEETYAQGVKV